MPNDTLTNDLKGILEQALKKIENVNNESDLESCRVEYLGKKSLISSSMKMLGEMDPEERADFGAFINKIKKEISEAIQSKKGSLKSKGETSLHEDDLSLPGRGYLSGTLHPITQVMHDAIEIFDSLGFEFVDGPEIEDEYHNFSALNIPENHPAKAMHDTFYFKNNKLLRTHTSSVQIRVMDKEKKPPIRIIAPGKVYRKDSDVTHTPMFHQIEGLYIDETVSFANLKSTLNIFLQNFFQDENLEVRFRPSYFPFTEPSAEVDIKYKDRNNKISWLEVLGCGMVHPNVLSMAKIDNKKYTGYAFGLGIERLAMLKLGITDIRMFYENDLRFLKQF
ncbi:MAG: phenylalanine--tRNA ligase subunit alpha [Pseudomonadota bacterium]|nr:phenylalanine--tRNA ligase subunit alpha [Gammaproteobacteria bacterium]MEC7885721.1 phenylalanine--tRNA ligase subunit alpha [Pseudomonadota bacterium]|tara:strand:+ start:2455 stop:3462 length:1008 start_codon:yes stop_codon:yes gene_type:complete